MFSQSNTLREALNIISATKKYFDSHEKEGDIEDNAPKSDLHTRIENFLYKQDNPEPRFESSDGLH